MYYLETGSTDPHYNLAFEEYLLNNKTTGDYLMLWQNDNTIVIGQNQNADAEINHACVEKEHITVARRMTGGGAVYHDLGNLNYSFITDSEEGNRMAFEKFTKPVLAALSELGLKAECSGRNDVLANGSKVSGTAQRLYKNRILFHGTLLFDADLEMVSRALNVDPEKLKSKGIKSVRSRVGNIKQILGTDMDISDFWMRIKESLLKDGGEEITLTEEELAAVDKLYREKYDTWEWNFGRSPEANITNKMYCPGGIIEVHILVENNVIKDVKFYGDFLAVSDTAEVAEALKGTRYQPEDVEEVLGGFDIGNYFGGITKEEVVKLIFME